MGSPIYAPVQWRFTILGPSGTGTWEKIAILTNLASDIEMLWQLNRSTMLSFSVPSDHPQVNLLHTDGLPYLAVGPRFVLGWRKAPPSLAPDPGDWQLKFAGRVWSLQDQGDGNTCRTFVTCFDMLKMLEKRIVRAANGTFNKQVKWWAAPGTTIAKDMIDRTQSFVGTCRIDTGGTWTDSSATTAAYDQAYILPSIINITDTGTMDLSPSYLDGSTGDFMLLGGSPRLGSDKSSVILGYAAPPRRATGFDRTTTLDNLANSVTLFGKSKNGHSAVSSDTTSKTTYDVFEDVSVVPDIETVELLQLLADEEVFLRKNPNDLISIRPTPEDSPRFFNEYFLGDTITVRASTTKDVQTREVVSGVQRVYGAHILCSNEYGETVDQLVTSANAETT